MKSSPPAAAPTARAAEPPQPTQGERAYATLRNEILRGALRAGERLRAADLRERYRLSLTPIREALTRLTSEGLVSGETHRGARVADASADDFADLMGARREIERACLARAIARGDAAWEAEIVASLHLLSRTRLPASPADTEAMATWEAQHRRFHAALVAACGSPWLLRVWNMLVDHSERYRMIRMLRPPSARPKARNVAAEHAAMADAVLARDQDRALALMDAHLTATERAVARHLEPPAPPRRAARR
ncbi:MAG: FCD domain-containing protein [Alphaproteobacteria bacterium]|nr:FCD domain-containing protein [Alphaproteobacteria bacterium]